MVSGLTGRARCSGRYRVMKGALFKDEMDEGSWIRKRAGDLRGTRFGYQTKFAGNAGSLGTAEDKRGRRSCLVAGMERVELKK